MSLILPPQVIILLRSAKGLRFRSLVESGFFQPLLPEIFITELSVKTSCVPQHLKNPEMPLDYHSNSTPLVKFKTGQNPAAKKLISSKTVS